MLLINLIFGYIILTKVYMYKQNDFKLILDHWEHHGYNKAVLNYMYVKNVKPNRTYKAVDIGFSNKRDLTGDTFKVHVQAFQFYHNEYRRTPMIFDVKACEALEQKLFGIEALTSNNGNLTTCPLKKNVYYVYNFNFNDAAWPPHFPRGKYQLKLTFMSDNIFLGAMSWFGSIEDILKY